MSNMKKPATSEYYSILARSMSVIIVILSIGLTGCNLGDSVLPSPPINVRLETTVTDGTPDVHTSSTGATALAGALVLPDNWLDASAVMEGFCFESMYDARGRIFILRDEFEQEALYDGADNSELCRASVTRQTFDYGEGRVIVGGWSHGIGCRTWHSIDNIAVDEEARTIAIEARFEIEGACPYDLIRPLWLATDEGRSEYAITLIINDE